MSKAAFQHRENRGNGDFLLIADPQILAVPVHDNQEPLVDLRTVPEILIGPSPEIDNNPCYTYVRASVAQRLQAACGLLPSAYRMCLYEGLRTLELQQTLFMQRWQLLAQQNPTWSERQLYDNTTQLVSPVTTLGGERNIPPHSTGAAVDVYLVDATSHEAVEMGLLAADWALDVEVVLAPTHSTQVSEQAREHRKILSAAMTAADFVNYPTEYWHWSYGDRYWAYYKGSSQAFYGPATAP